MRVIRVLVRLVAIVIAVLVLVAAVAIGRGYALINQHFERPLAERTIAADSASIARGAHLTSITCTGCHAGAGSTVLSGSDFNFAAEPTPKMGQLWAPNITPGGVLRDYSDAELARALREGIRRDGSALMVMPSAGFRMLTDSDLDAVLAYLRSQPPDPRVVPARQLNVAAALFIGLGLLPTSVQPAPVPTMAVAEGPTAEYGDYLVRLADCRSCHGQALRGGSAAPGMTAPDIAGVADSVSAEVFDRALRGGISADGRPLDPSRMPWPLFKRFTDIEAAAVAAYVKSLP